MKSHALALGALLVALPTGLRAAAPFPADAAGVEAEVRAFYARVDARAPREEITVHIHPEIHSKVKILRKESRGEDAWFEALEGVLEKYPYTARTLDRFEIDRLDEGTWRARFHLTSRIHRDPEMTKPRLLFRAKMEFHLVRGEDGAPRIKEYLARPLLRTLPRTLWAHLKAFFG